MSFLPIEVHCNWYIWGENTAMAYMILIKVRTDVDTFTPNLPSLLLSLQYSLYCSD